MHREGLEKGFDLEYSVQKKEYDIRKEMLLSKIYTSTEEKIKQVRNEKGKMNQPCSWEEKEEKTDSEDKTTEETTVLNSIHTPT